MRARLPRAAAQTVRAAVRRGLGGVAVGVIEIGGDGDDGLGDFLTDFRLGIGLELAEDHACDFLGGVGFAFASDFYFDVGVAIGGGDDLVGHALVGIGELRELAADEALGREDGVFRVGDGLAFCGLADETFAVLGECDHGRSGAGTPGVFKNSGLAAVHDGHAGVCGAEVDS